MQLETLHYNKGNMEKVTEISFKRDDGTIERFVPASVELEEGNKVGTLSHQSDEA